jgi:hypothetical protein
MVLITDEEKRRFTPKLHWKQKEYAVARVLECESLAKEKRGIENEGFWGLYIAVVRDE